MYSVVTSILQLPQFLGYFREKNGKPSLFKYLQTHHNKGDGLLLNLSPPPPTHPPSKNNVHFCNQYHLNFLVVFLNSRKPFPLKHSAELTSKKANDFSFVPCAFFEGKLYFCLTIHLIWPLPSVLRRNQKGSCKRLKCWRHVQCCNANACITTS